jgi:hypothetical protein
MGILEDLGLDKWLGTPRSNPAIRAASVAPSVFRTLNKPKKAPTPKPPRLGYVDPQARRDLVSDVYTKRGRPDPYAVQDTGRSTTDEIFERLQALQDPSRYMPDDGSLSAQALSSVAAQYDPVIAALRNQMSQAQTTADQHYQQLGQMYSSLSDSYMADLPAIASNYDKAEASVSDVYGDLRNRVTQQYQDSQNQQADIMAKLNIQAAAPGTLPQQQRDQDFFNNLASKDEATANAALNMQQTGDEEFTRKGSQIARYEGANKQSTLMEQLRELLGAYQSQIGQQEAARSAAAANALLKLRTDSSDSASRRAQQEFENYVTSIRLMSELGGKEVGPVQSPADVPTRAMSFGLDPQQAQRVQNVFNTALDSDMVIQEGINPTYGTPLTSAAKAARMRELGTQMGLTSQELNALRYLALEYFG